MQIVPQRNIFQRAANRLGRPFRVFPFPVAFESSLDQENLDIKQKFDLIYQENYWNSPESLSGAGSEIAATARYRPQLVKAITDLKIKSIFDAPCGDLNWMPMVLRDLDIQFIGGDIADRAVSDARRSNPDLDIRLFDICKNEFPDVDLWHCRDTFFHLSFADIKLALRQACASNIRFAALTTHKTRFLRNMDISTGGFRLLDLERAPFNFPPAVTYLSDHSLGEMPRYVGVWLMESIRAALNR